MTDDLARSLVLCYLMSRCRLLGGPADDDPEFDALCDQADGPWYRLTPAEVKTLDEFSAALHRIEPIPTPEPTR